MCAIDVESNGLHGQPFAVGAVILDGDLLVSTYVDRCPIDAPVDPWVQANVLAAVQDMPETSPDYKTMLGNLRHWRETTVADVPLIAHVGWPVEARLFADAYGHDPELAFSGPYPLHELASMLLLTGEQPDSADAYLAKYGITKPPGREHNPVYDAFCTALVAQHLLARFARSPSPGVADAPR